MSDAPHTHAPHKAYKASRSGNTGMKWLAGGAAAALLLGGGYYAWTAASSNQSATEVADAYFSSPSATEEAIWDDSIVQELPAAAPLENYNEPPPAPQIAPAPAKPKKAQVAAAEIPTATIGVSEASVTTTQSDDVIVNAPRRPVWTRMPSAERLSSYYPANALDRGREGEASLQCTVGERGALDCVRVSETPARAGFGAAALRVSRTLRHAPKNADGQDAVGTPVNLRVLFRMAEDERRG